MSCDFLKDEVVFIKLIYYIGICDQRSRIFEIHN